jgi:hypothetical protein
MFGVSSFLNVIMKPSSMPFRSLHAPDKKAVSFVYSVPFVFVSLVSLVDLDEVEN